MVNNNYLSDKGIGLSWWILNRASCNIASLNLVSFDFNVKTHIIPWLSFLNLLMVHLNRFNLSFDVTWSESYVHFLLKNSSLNSSDSNCSKTLNFVDIVDWNSQWFFGWPFWGLHIIQNF
jgi:hypothetical protein